MAAPEANLDAHELVQEAMRGADRQHCNKIYDNWGEKYDADMKEINYVGSQQLLEHFPKLNVSKDAKILDVCCGTGAIGRELVKMGYSDLHAIDGADGMIAKAKAEGNYKSITKLLFEPDSKLPFAEGEFDCVVLAGVFAPGHLPIVALREVCRVTKKGGIVCLCCCDPLYYQDKDEQYANNGFYKVVDELKEKGCWKEHEGFPVEVPYIEYSKGYVMAFDKIGDCQ